MGACIVRKQENLVALCHKKPQFQTPKPNPNPKKSLLVFEITSSSCQPVPWPFHFSSTCAYMAIIATPNPCPSPILQPDRTSIQFAEMVFGAQFLCPHLQIVRKLMLANRQYGLAVYSMYGDSQEEEEFVVRGRLAYYMDMVDRMLEFGAGWLCLWMLNQADPINHKDEIKQFIDFQSEQYEQARNHPFFKQQLFSTSSQTLLSNSIAQCKKSLYFTSFLTGHSALPHIQIKEIQGQDKHMKFTKNRDKNKEKQEQLPFACEITQINIKGNPKKANKIESGAVDESNLLFDELGIENQLQDSQKIQQFLKGLYLSTQKISKNYPLLSEHHIKLLINCSASVSKNWFLNDFNYKWIDMPDPISPTGTHGYNIECLIYQIADLAGKYLEEPAGVLVHCAGYTAGVDGSGCRSAGVVVGVIMVLGKIGYEQALATITKKWKVKLPSFMEKQLRQLQKRRTHKPKCLQVYCISSYSKNFPGHLVAKYICQVENISNVQGLDNFSKCVFLCVGATSAKILIGRECQYKEQYEEYAKEHLRLLGKYEGFHGQVTVQPIDKTFRKQPKIDTTEQLLLLDPKSPTKNAGFLRNEQIVLKYPILRPVWQKKKQDGFYYTLRQKGHTAEVLMNKGMNWIGYEKDKEDFFDKIIKKYLAHVSDQNIFIVEADNDRSLFDSSELQI